MKLWSDMTVKCRLRAIEREIVARGQTYTIEGGVSVREFEARQEALKFQRDTLTELLALREATRVVVVDPRVCAAGRYANG